MISYITRFTDLSNKPFIVRPKPQEDELLSSWLVRVALAHNTLPVSFVNMHFPKYKNIIFSRDLDIWVPDDLLESIQQKSQYGECDIKAMMLRSYSGVLAPKIEPNGRNLFISPIKVRGRRNQAYGQRYCPHCLQEDRIVYFRKQWRLSFLTVCHKHHCYLLDRCPNCSEALSIYKFSDKYGFDHCYNCGYVLSTSSVQYYQEDQRWLDELNEVLVKGFIFIDGKKVEASLFFELLHSMLSDTRMILKLTDNKLSLIEVTTIFRGILTRIHTIYTLN